MMMLSAPSYLSKPDNICMASTLIPWGRHLGVKNYTSVIEICNKKRD